MTRRHPGPGNSLFWRSLLLAGLGWFVSHGQAEEASPSQLPAPTVAPVVAPVPEATAESLKKFLPALRQGGYVIFLRHMESRLDVEDASPLSLGDCRTQRPLSDRGREQAQTLGRAWRRQGIPVAVVHTSPFCRCQDTARLAFPPPTPVWVDNDLYFSFDIAQSERERKRLALRRLLSMVPPAGSNAVVVSHSTNLQEALGLWPKPEGLAVIIQPGPGGPRPLWRISPELWASLADGP